MDNEHTPEPLKVSRILYKGWTTGSGDFNLFLRCHRTSMYSMGRYFWDFLRILYEDLHVPILEKYVSHREASSDASFYIKRYFCLYKYIVCSGPCRRNIIGILLLTTQTFLKKIPVHPSRSLWLHAIYKWATSDGRLSRYKHWRL